MLKQTVPVVSEVSPCGGQEDLQHLILMCPPQLIFSIHGSLSHV